MNLNTILIIVAVAIFGVAISFLLGYFQVYPFTIVYTTISGWMGTFDFQTAVSNPATIVTAVGGAAAVAVPLVSKLNSVKNQAQTTLSNAETQISGLSGQLSSATTKLQTAETNVTDLTQKLSNTETLNAQLTSKTDFYKSEFDKLQNQYKELQKITSADVIGKLPAGTIIPNADGSKTVVVEKTIVK